MSGWFSLIQSFLSGGRGEGQQEGQAAGLATVLQQAMSPEGGGVNSLLSRFQSAGLGDQVQSWIGTGANQLITPEHINQVFSNQELQSWAAQAGLPVDQIKEMLAQYLPQAVDQVTPEGQPPTAGAEGSPDLASLVGRFFNR